jgi:hypothetical protein
VSSETAWHGNQCLPPRAADHRSSLDCYCVARGHGLTRSCGKTVGLSKWAVLRRTETGYDGSRRQYNNVDDYNLITVDPIGSAYNNRGKRTHLNQNFGSSSICPCFGAGDYDGARSGWQTHAKLGTSLALDELLDV